MKKIMMFLLLTVLLLSLVACASIVPQGAQGPQGETGDDGLSAFEIFKKHYPEYTGTEKEWIYAVSTNDICSLFGHTVVIDKAVQATCTTNGLTEGCHCEICGEVIVEQTMIEASHNYVGTVCSVCGFDCNTNSETNEGENTNNATPEYAKLSKEQWNTIFETMANISNVSFTILLTTDVDNNGTVAEISSASAEISENATHEIIIDESGTSEFYYTNENGTNYRFENQSGVWLKQSVNHSSSLKNVMINNILLFKDMYDEMNYNSENDTYFCKNRPQNDPFLGTYMYYEISIKISDGNISELTYIVDTFINSNTPTKCKYEFKFKNFGTTTVNLPSN